MSVRAKYEVVIGIETHAQLSTVSKIFSGSSTQFGADANTQASGIDIALPGVLPVLNRGAVERAIRFGLAVGSTIAEKSVFARKNYFYPDLPKGYQISQFELPVVIGGSVSFVVDGVEKTVRLTRAHLEEDAGKSLHEDYASMSGIDLNRAGTPLLEIVTEPDMRSAAEAVAYAKTLHGIVTTLDICDGNLQEGSFRCDANVSVRPVGQAEMGTRCEIKNLNSFRFLEKAIDYEVRRQIELIEDGGKVVQQTRLYDPDQDETRAMRGKEDAMDYRYFPDPDLLPLKITRDWIEQIRAALPELPAARAARFSRDYGLTAYDAATLTQTRATADYYEATLNALGVLPNAVVQSGAQTALAKSAANWLLGELSAWCNEHARDLANPPISAVQLAGILLRISDGTISGKIAKDVFAAIVNGATNADAVIEARGLRQISDVGALVSWIDHVIDNNPDQVSEYWGGKEKAFNYLVGQVMKLSKGKANPTQVSGLLAEKLTLRKPR